MGLLNCCQLKTIMSSMLSDEHYKVPLKCYIKKYNTVIKNPYEGYISGTFQENHNIIKWGH